MTDRPGTSLRHTADRRALGFAAAHLTIVAAAIAAHRAGWALAWAAVPVLAASAFV
jgi:hypothetical protein